LEFTAPLNTIMKHEDKVDLLAEVNEEAVIFHGIEDALVGYVERFGMEPIAVYDRAKVIECLMADGETTHEDAEEWFGYNTIGTWAGDGTPCFVTFFEEEEECRFSTMLKDWWTTTVTRITATLAACGRLFRRDGK